ncbi:hypothetical protein LCGC14_0585370 [marine sediment metagenome]|uniref:Uncharacterized protein n=1 Tax=marine sediment metagenome TaxID=412755 RepID=A0A0F9RF62_9ZZZZ
MKPQSSSVPLKPANLPVRYPFIVFPYGPDHKGKFRFQGIITELEISVGADTPEECIAKLDEQVVERWSANATQPSSSWPDFSAAIVRYVYQNYLSEPNSRGGRRKGLRNAAKDRK